MLPNYRVINPTVLARSFYKGDGLDHSTNQNRFQPQRGGRRGFEAIVPMSSPSRYIRHKVPNKMRLF